MINQLSVSQHGQTCCFTSAPDKTRWGERERAELSDGWRWNTAKLFTSSIRLTALWEWWDHVVKILASKWFMPGFCKKILQDRLHHVQCNSTWMVLALPVPCRFTHIYDFSFVPMWQKSTSAVCFCKQDLSALHHPFIMLCSHQAHRPMKPAQRWLSKSLY